MNQKVGVRSAAWFNLARTLRGGESQVSKRKLALNLKLVGLFYPTVCLAENSYKLEAKATFCAPIRAR